MFAAKDTRGAVDGAADDRRRGFLGSLGMAVAAVVSVFAGGRLAQAQAQAVDSSSEPDESKADGESMHAYRRLLDRVREMEAHEEIKELRALYCWYATRADAKHFGELFTSDCTFEYQLEGQRRWFKGRQAVADIVAQITPGTVTPVVGNHMIRVEDDVAHGTCAMRNTIRRDGKLVNEVGFYSDRLRYEQGRWRFAERRWFTYSPVYEENDVAAV